MELQTLTYIVVGLSFALYIGIAFWSKARTTGDFYVAGKHVHPVANGMATAADWMSAASFISMAGLIAFLGYDSSVYLMGWTGGYVLLALLLAPYLRRFGKFTVPEFIGERYYSDAARVVAVICLIVISFTYVAGQMRGVGIVFSRFLNVDISVGLAVGMAVVFSYAVLGGMKGITYTQVAQYCVLIFAYTVPAVFISLQVTGVALPQVAFGSEVINGAGSLLVTLDRIVTDLGFSAYTSGSKDTVDIFFITLALMIGTAGLPHVLVRFFTVAQGAPRTGFRRLCAVVYRHSLHHGAGRGCAGPAQPHYDHPDGAGVRGDRQPALRRKAGLVPGRGKTRDCCGLRTRTAMAAFSTTTTRTPSLPSRPKRMAGAATN